MNQHHAPTPESAGGEKKSRSLFRKEAPKIAVIYGIFGCLWILLSDRILGLLIHDTATMGAIQTVKGWLYVFVTALLVYHLVAVEARRRDRESRAAALHQTQHAIAMSVAGMGSWYWELGNESIQFDDHLFRLLGYSPGEFRPKTEFWRENAHPDDIQNLGTFITSLLSGKDDTADIEFRVRNKQGAWIWFLGRGQIIQKDNWGQPLAAAGVVLDIDERKKLEEFNKKAKETAEQANKAKSEFLASMSHEIRTPLSGVLGMLRLLEESNPTKEQKELLRTASDSGQSLLIILDEILNISRIEAGKLDLKPSTFSVEDLTYSVERSFLPMLHEQGRSIKVSIESDTLQPAYLGDVEKIRQVLANLLNNAIKFSKGKDVQLNVRALPLSTKHGHYNLLFTIEDHGIGVPDEKQEYIFKPFTQLDNKLSREYKGAGLGLKIVCSLLELLNGSMCMDSEYGRGTIFHVSIPVNQGDAERLRQHETESITPELSPLNVLVVEDDRINRITATRFLSKLGHQSDIAEDGLVAVEKLAAHDYDCILMDIQMPRMSGIEATRAIRTEASLIRHRDTPIIALTAHAMPEDKKNFLAAGMDDYLTKPLDLNKLEDVLSKIKRKEIE